MSAEAREDELRYYSLILEMMREADEGGANSTGVRADWNGSRGQSTGDQLVKRFEWMQDPAWSAAGGRVENSPDSLLRGHLLWMQPRGSGILPHWVAR